MARRDRGKAPREPFQRRRSRPPARGRALRSQDAGEPGIEGVTLSLTGTDGAGNTVNATTTTDANGAYHFTEAPGTYTVTVTAPAGYTASPTGQGTPATDSNVNPTGTTPAALHSGGSDLTDDFGFYKPVTVGDFVWVDANANGVQDAGEAGIQGVTLTLTGTNGAGAAVTDHATTDATGHYLFTEAPGNYTVTLDATNPALSGYTATATGKGTTATDSNVNPSATTPSTLPGGSADLTIDFGFYKPATISGYNYVDANNNGLLDSGETLIAGTTMTLTGSNALGPIAPITTTTDAGGFSTATTPSLTWRK